MSRLRAVLTLALMLVCLLAPAASASAAPALPGTDCLRPPVPASPSAGLAASIDPGPAVPREGAPWGPDAASSLHDVYGYAGHAAVVFDPGCVDVARIIDMDNSLGNAFTSASGVLIAVSARLSALVTDGTFGSLWDPAQAEATRILGRGVWVPLVGLFVMVAVLVSAARTRMQDPAAAASFGMWTVGLAVAGMLVMTYALTVGAAVDRGVSTAVSTAGQVATSSAGGRAPQDMVAGTMIESTMYRTWQMRTFGGHPAAAEEFGPALFTAGAFTRAEQTQIDADPSKAGPMIEAKQAEYKAVAKQVQDKYPQAYEFLAGHQTQVGSEHALAGLLSTLVSVAYLIYCLVMLAWAMVVVKIGLGLAPLILLVALIPGAQHLAMELVGWIVRALVRAAALTFAFMVYLVGIVGGILAPASDWDPAVKALAVGMAALAMHLLLRRMGVVGKPRGKNKKKKEEPVHAGRHRADQPPPTPPPSPTPPSSPPIPSSPAALTTRRAHPAAGGTTVSSHVVRRADVLSTPPALPAPSAAVARTVDATRAAPVAKTAAARTGTVAAGVTPAGAALTVGTVVASQVASAKRSGDTRNAAAYSQVMTAPPPQAVGQSRAMTTHRAQPMRPSQGPGPVLHRPSSAPQVNTRLYSPATRKVQS